MSRRTLVVNGAAGVAGDMLLAALLELGAPREHVERALRPLGLDTALVTSSVDRAGIRATQLVVAEEIERTPLDEAGLRGACEAADLGHRGRELVAHALDLVLLGERTAHGGHAHGLHELGSLDTVLDLVATAAAFEALDVDGVLLGPVATGLGAGQMAHGVYPIPAPAVAAIAAATGLVVELRPGAEATTPTGAALLGALTTLRVRAASGAITAVAYGAGTRDDPDRANVVQVLLLEDRDAGIELVGIIDTWVDDLSGEDLGRIADEAIAAGALDAWLVPGHGKKGRPGFELHVVCAPHAVESLVAWVHRRTRSPGVRHRVQERSVLEAHIHEVEVHGVSCRVKVTEVGAKCEDDDAHELAAALGMDVSTARALALAAWRASAVAGDLERREHRGT